MRSGRAVSPAPSAGGRGHRSPPGLDRFAPDLASPESAACNSVPDMIARSANGVIDVNIYPGGSNSQATYVLLANTLTSPEPRLTILVLGALAAGFRGWRRSRR